VRRAYARAAVEQAVVSGVTDHGDDFTLVYEETAPGEGVGELVAITPTTSENGDSTPDGASNGTSRGESNGTPDGYVAAARHQD
jgi:hypothetical protein